MEMVDNSLSSQICNSMKMTRSQVKGADNVKYFDYLNIPPSLETIAQFNVCIRILTKSSDKELIELIYSMADSPDSDDCDDCGSLQNMDKAIEELVELDLPMIILHQLIYFFKVFIKEVAVIVCYLKFGRMKLKSLLDLKWTSWGTLDKFKTLQEIIQSEKYKTDELNKSLLYQMFEFESSILEMFGNSSGLLRVDDSNKQAFMKCLTIGGEAGCRCYLKKLPSDKKDDIIIEIVKIFAEGPHKSSLNSNCFCLLFFNMGNKPLLIDVIAKNEIFVTWLLSWPWIIFFEKYLEENYLEYFCNVSQVHIFKKVDEEMGIKNFSLFKRLSKNIPIRNHFNKLLSGES